MNRGITYFFVLLFAWAVLSMGSGITADAQSLIVDKNLDFNNKSIFNVNGLSIGTTTVQASGNFYISGNTTVGGTLNAGTLTGTYSGTVTAPNTSAGAFGANTGGGSYTFPAGVTIDTDSFHVDATANRVGVGTNLPGYKLDVQGGQANTSGGFCIAGDCRSSWAAVAPPSGWTDGGVDMYPTTLSDSVGIGTNTPGYPLDVSGVINVLGGSGIRFNNDVSRMVATGASSVDLTSSHWGNELFIVDADNNDTNRYFAFAINSTTLAGATELMRLTEAGNLGIGTNAPGQKLSVIGSIDTSAQFLGQGADSVSAPSFSWTGDTNNGIFRPAADVIALTTAGVERMRVGATGNVGVGNVSPGYKLSVAGTIESTSGGVRFPDGTTQTTAFTGSVAVNASEVSSGTFGLNTGGGNYVFPANTAVSSSLGVATNTATGLPQELSVYGDAYISGNAGLGVTVPSYKLAFAANTVAAGGIGFGADTELYRSAANTLALGSGDSLNLVSGDLQVAGTGVITSGRLVQAANGSAALPAYTFSADTNTGIYGTGADVFRISTAGADRVAVDASGNVGVGTIIPGYKLDVQGGQINTSVGLCIAADCKTAWSQVGGGGGWTDGGVYIYPTTLTDNVGVGTTTPIEKLSVAGNAKLNIDGASLILRTLTLDTASRPKIQFLNNNLAIIAGDDHSNQTFSFMSSYSGSRTNDAELKVHGSAANWNTYLSLKHDGVDGTITTDVGDIALMPAANVGIGLTTPAHKLELVSNTTAAGGIGFGTDVELYRSAADTLALASGDSLNLVSGALQVAGTGVITSGRILQAANGSAAAPSFTFSADANTGMHGTGVDVLNLVTAGADRVTVDASGNVGIGTTAPGYKLVVNGDIIIPNTTGQLGVSSDFVFRDSIDTWLRLFSAVNGAVGTTPYGDLAVKRIWADSDALLKTKVIIGPGLPVNALDVGGAAVIGTAYSGVSTGPANGLAVQGNVGIGTVTPGYKLDVQGGQINASGGLCIAADCKTAWSQVGGGGGWTDGGTVMYQTTLADNVGLGVSSVTHKLEFAAGTTAAAGIGFGADTELYRSAANILSLASGDTFNLVLGSVQVGSVDVITSGRVVQAANGLTAAPSFTFSADTNTGMYSGGADILRLATGGADRLGITAAGDVNVVTGNLQLAGTNVITSGRLVQAANGSAAAPSLSFAGDPNTGVYGTGGDTLRLSTAGADRVSIGGGGNVGIGTTVHNNILTIVQTSVTDPIADAWTIYSSRRWKENIKPIGNALQKVKDLRGVSFDWKKGGKHDIGLIAEEVARVIPEVVQYESDGITAQSIDYARLVSVLIEAVKEQQERVDSLESQIRSR